MFLVRSSIGYGAVVVNLLFGWAITFGYLAYGQKISHVLLLLGIFGASLIPTFPICWPCFNLLYPIHLSFFLGPITKKSLRRIFLPSSHSYPNVSNEPLNYYDNLNQQFNKQAYVLMSQGLNGKLKWINSREHIIKER